LKIKANIRFCFTFSGIDRPSFEQLFTLLSRNNNLNELRAKPAAIEFSNKLIRFAPYFPNVPKEIIVIIGGPGTGKTTLIDALVNRGYCCYPEISRQVTMEAKKQGIEQLFLENPLLFSELLLEGRKKQFVSAQNEPHETVFIDRGIPDVLAYMHYIGDAYPTGFDLACREHVYSKIFVLPPWEEIYISDDERYENFEQAKLIYGHLTETYRNYGYELIEVPKGSVDERINFILAELSKK
jgi:predicted ATPase